MAVQLGQAVLVTWPRVPSRPCGLVRAFSVLDIDHGHLML
jgi:hypothetical protein